MIVGLAEKRWPVTVGQSTVRLSLLRVFGRSVAQDVLDWTLLVIVGPTPWSSNGHEEAGSGDYQVSDGFEEEGVAQSAG